MRGRSHGKGYGRAGYQVISTDLIYRGYGDEKSVDFLHEPIADFDGDIITNPPYKYALQFVEKALEKVKPGRKVAMFLKLQFLEGKSRKQFFLKHPPKTVYVSSSRLICAMNGEFEKYPSSAVEYAWFVWEKAYCAMHEAELKNIALNINVDMIGCIMGNFIACCTAEEKLVHYIEYFGQETRGIQSVKRSALDSYQNLDDAVSLTDNYIYVIFASVVRVI